MKCEESETRKEFAFVEYHEAANAYLKGVDVGYTTTKHYMTVNGLLVALLVAVTSSGAGALASAGGMVKFVPAVALIISLAFSLTLPHYFKHLENCRKRCEDIERDYGGKLFTNLGGVAQHRTAFHTGLGLSAIIGLVVILWICFAATMLGWI